jgi:hypothetical protein
MRTKQKKIIIKIIFRLFFSFLPQIYYQLFSYLSFLIIMNDMYHIISIGVRDSKVIDVRVFQ